jgi:ATP-binding cassette subfamily B protein
MMIIRTALRSPFMLIFSLVSAIYINKKMALIYLAIIPVLALALFIIANVAHPMFKKVFETYDKLNTDVQENVRGIRVVKSFVKEEYEKEKFSKVSKLIYDKFVSAEKVVSYNGPVMQLSMYAGIILISWFGSKMIVNSTLTTGELTSLITYGAAILSSLMMISMTFVFLTLAISSAERIVELLDEESNLHSPENPVMEVKDGSIVFKNVYFGYSSMKDEKVLKNINLNIKSGETIGIIGSTGSSKSSLVNLISRLYDVNKGEVLVGGVNVKDYDLDVLRNNVSVVLQKNVLFSGTIKENLRWGKKDATELEMIEACSAACADEFIDELKDKYDSHVDQGGNNFSGGQKQRLCIARALLKRPKILILDDSTSAVDTATDNKIREAFKKYIPDVTKIIIAQRINSIEHADRVIVLDNGKVNAFDTPKNLLKNNKIYQEVYHSQVKGGK